MDALKDPYKKSKGFCINVCQRTLALTYHYYSLKTTPWSPGEKSPEELLGHPYRYLLPNLQASVNATNDTDQDFKQQNHIQMQEKCNAELGPDLQTTIQLQLNEGQYVMFVSWTCGTIRKLLNNGK